MADAIRAGELAGIVGRLGNVMETVTVEMVPAIGKLKQKMLRGGALGSLMSGSGPTVFGIFDDRAKAERVLSEIEKENLAMQVFLTKPV